MELFRSLGHVSKYRKYFKQSSSRNNVSFEEYSIHCNRIKFEVKLKVNQKYERRSLEIMRRSSGEQEWMLYVVKYADYTSYDYFRLSENFITQLFNAKDSKCTLVLVEGVLQFKMASVSDKWRLVEFLRANLDSGAQIFEGSLKQAPGRKISAMTSLPVRVYFKNSTIVLSEVAAAAPSVLLHTSLANFEMVVCKEQTVSFVFRKSDNVPEFWSIHISKTENVHFLADCILESRHLHNLSFGFNLQREPFQYTCLSPCVPFTDF